jgi:hypothetical protein
MITLHLLYLVEKKHFMHRVSHEGLLNVKPEKATFTWYYETVST